MPLKKTALGRRTRHADLMRKIRKLGLKDCQLPTPSRSTIFDSQPSQLAELQNPIYMANLNQRDLASYLIRELMGNSTIQPQVNRISHLLDELKRTLNGVAQPTSAYDCALEINGNLSDAFSFNEERVRSRTFRAPCCDVTLIALHAPHCKRHDAQSRSSLPQPAAPLSSLCLETPHNTSCGGLEANKNFALLPSNYELSVSKTDSKNGNLFTMPPLKPSLATKINSSIVLPQEYVVEDSSSSSDEPIHLEVKHRAAKKKGPKTSALNRPYAKWDENKAKQAHALIEEAMKHTGDDFSNYSVRRMAEQLRVSQSSMYKYLKLTRPEIEGGPRKVLDLSGRRGLTENPTNVTASTLEFTEHLFKILEAEDALSVTQIRERLPIHLRRTKRSILRSLKRMNCVRRTVSAITASKDTLPPQARSGGSGHHVSGYWSLTRAKSSRETHVVEVKGQLNRSSHENDQVIAVRKAYADCILSFSQSTPATGDPMGEANFSKSLIFVNYKRYSIDDLISKRPNTEGICSSRNGQLIEILVSLSVKGVMDYKVNSVTNLIPVANTFVPFVGHTVDLINQAKNIENLVPLVLVVDRGSCQDVESMLDQVIYNMAFKDPSHSLIYLPPGSDSLNPVTQFMHDLLTYVRGNCIPTSSSNGDASSANADALCALCSIYIKAIANNNFTPLYQQTQNYICMAANYQYF